MTRCFSLPPLTQEDCKVNECGAEGFLLLLCCSVLLVQMKLYDNHKSANLVSPLYTQRGWEAINNLKEAFFSPSPGNTNIFVLILSLFLKNLMCYSWVYTTTKKRFLNLFICYLTVTKDKFYFHISSIFSSKGSFVGVVPHQLANMSFRQLIWLW